MSLPSSPAAAPLRVAVTGSTGLLGREIVAQLASLDVPVVALRRREQASKPHTHTAHAEQEHNAAHKRQHLHSACGTSPGKQRGKHNRNASALERIHAD